MTLNGTLFVQIINFIIAYCIIDRLLLRKAVFIIQKERAQQDDLMKEIQVQRDLVAAKEADKKDEWEKLRDQFDRNTPKVLEQSFSKFSETQPKFFEKPSQKEVTELKGTLKSMLIDEVTNVRN